MHAVTKKLLNHRLSTAPLKKPVKHHTLEIGWCVPPVFHVVTLCEWLGYEYQAYVLWRRICVPRTRRLTGPSRKGQWMLGFKMYYLKKLLKEQWSYRWFATTKQTRGITVQKYPLSGRGPLIYMTSIYFEYKQHADHWIEHSPTNFSQVITIIKVCWIHNRESFLIDFLVQLPWASYQIRKIAGWACAGNAGNVFPASEVYRSRHASRHVSAARAVIHAGIDN